MYQPLSTEDARARDVNARVGLAVCKNCCVGLAIGEKGMRRNIKVLFLVILLERVTENSVVEGYLPVVLSDLLTGLVVIDVLDSKTDAALSCVVGSKHFRNVITEVATGAEVASGIAVEPFGRSLYPECVALRETSAKFDTACRFHVSYHPELLQVRNMY